MKLTIEKLVYGGDGLGRLPADERGPGKAMFVPFVLVGEEVEVGLREERPGFARGQLETLLKASPRRIDPACPYFTRCGGCHYQHMLYEDQLQIKVDILRETFQRIAKIELEDVRVHAAEPWGYRNRARLRVHTKPEFALGYYRVGSHELLAVEQCPISSPLIQRAIELLWKQGRSDAIGEGIREIELFANAADDRLLVELLVLNPEDSAHRQTAESLRAAMPEIGGVAVMRAGLEPDRSAVQQKSPARENKAIAYGDRFLSYTVAGRPYRVSAGAFFQTNRFLGETLVDLVTGSRSGRLALDLFAGTGLFAVALAETFERVVAVESAPESYEDLRVNVPPHVKTVQATTEDYLRTSGRGGADLVVVDPPRSGLGEKVVKGVLGLNAPQLTYVSCDPATLARDVKALAAGGYKIERADLVDLFPQTYHLETVLQLAR